MEASSGTVYAMQQRIIAKLVATDATSTIKAVTAQGANFDMQEQNWLDYASWFVPHKYAHACFCRVSHVYESFSSMRHFFQSP